MPIKQSYAQHGDACATAHAMELLGDRWTYPVLRELMLGPKRFREISASVRGITPAVLTTRLRELEHNGLVRRGQLPRPAGVGVYEPTEWARELSPVFEALGRWAQASPTYSIDGCGLTPDAAIQSMLTMAPRTPPAATIELALHLYDGRLESDAGYRYRVRWTDRLSITRNTETTAAATAATATATVHADSSTWSRVLYEGLALEAVEIEGERRGIERLVSAFRGDAAEPT